MSNIGGAEIFVVLLLALLVLGPERLPKAARQVGSFVRQVRQMSSGFQAEIRNAIDVEDRPFTPEEARIRPVPAIGDRSTDASSEAGIGPSEGPPELETEVRARHGVDNGVDHGVAPPPTGAESDGSNGLHSAAPADERAAG